MTYTFIYIVSDELSKYLFPVKEQQSTIIKVQKNDLQKARILSDIELIAYFNKQKQENVKITKIEITKDFIDIKIQSNFENIIDFLHKIEKNFIVKHFELKSDDFLACSIRVDKKFYLNFLKIGNKEKKKGILFNPFIMENRKNIVSAKDFNIDAIVDLEILINGKWYKKDDKIDQYKVLSISKNKVILLNTQLNKKVIKNINND